jgi:hypothetical protein
MASAHPVRRRRTKRKSIRRRARRLLVMCLFVPFAVFVALFVVACLVTRTLAVTAWQLATWILGPAPESIEPIATEVTDYLPAVVVTRIAPTS